VTSAREGGVGEANSVSKLPEQRGANGGLDGDARTMATLLEQVLDGIFFFSGWNTFYNFCWSCS